jgi:hypothetical protein
VLFAGLEPDHVAGPDLFDRAAVALDPAAAGDDDQGLAQRVGMPGRAGARLEGDQGAGGAGRIGRAEQGIDPDRAGEPGRRADAGRAAAASLDLQDLSPPSLANTAAVDDAALSGMRWSMGLDGEIGMN